jgi:N-acetylglucosamine kinase-like BadF-type ATPase
VPAAEQAAVFADLAASACRQAGASLGDVGRIAIGANGVDFVEEWTVQHRELCRLAGFPPDRTALVNDGIPALWGASPDRRSAVIQLGSALTSACRPELGSETVFDALDLAGLYDLRRQVVPVVARMLDGRSERTGLAERLLDHLGTDEAGFGHAVYRSAEVRARLLTAGAVVAQAWLAGDQAATVMIEAAADDLATLAAAIARRLGRGRFTCALGGGALRSLPPAFHDLVARRIAEVAPEAQVGRPRLAPELGAVLMAAHAAGLDAALLFERLAMAEAA